MYFIYSEKATKFWEIFLLLLNVCTVVKSKGKISQNFKAFSEYMNFSLSIAKSKRSKLAWEMFSALSFQEDVFVTNYLVGIVI